MRSNCRVKTWGHHARRRACAVVAIGLLFCLTDAVCAEGPAKSAWQCNWTPQPGLPVGKTGGDGQTRDRHLCLATTDSRFRFDAQTATSYVLCGGLSLVLLGGLYLLPVRRLKSKERALQKVRVELEAEVKKRTAELAEGRNFLEQIINSIGDPIFVKDRQHRGVLVNDAFCHLMGSNREDLLGKSDDQHACYSEGEAHTFKSQDELVFETGQESVNEETLTSTDGKVHTLLTKKTRYVDEQGREFIVGVARDVTTVKQAETELRWKTAFLEALLVSAIDGVLVVNDQGRKVFQNQRLLELWQIPGEIASDPDDAKQVEHVMKQVKNPQQFVAEIKRLYGQPNEVTHDEIEFIDGTILDRHSYPVVAQDGTRYGRIWQFRDVTQRKRAEAELAYERDLLRALLDTTPDAIYFKDRQSRFLRCSRSMAGFFKVGAIGELVGKTDFDLFTEEHARQAFEDEQKIIRTGEPLIAKVEKETWPDGRVTWALSSKMPLRDVEGEVIGTLGISKDITPIKDAEAKLEAAHRQLVEISREAGMAEVATSVLHNVGNVLNSINVSVTVIAEAVKHSKVKRVEQLAGLLGEHREALAGFLTTHPKGKQVPDFLARVATHLVQEQARLLREVEEMRQNVEHVKDIVMMQQSYARVSGVTEKVKVADLVEDALRMNSEALVRHEVAVIRDYVQETAEITVDRHKVLQILVNLIRNAKSACDESGRNDKRMTVRISNDHDRIRISVADNGVGILPQNMTRIFNHGFTTRKTGHGFGLHSGALAAREIGGTLTAQSDGPGKGACFSLDLPAQPPTR